MSLSTLDAVSLKLIRYNDVDTQVSRLVLSRDGKEVKITGLPEDDRIYFKVWLTEPLDSLDDVEGALSFVLRREKFTTVLGLCVYYNESVELWVSQDLRLEHITNDSVICSTSHLTDFGVLLGANVNGNNGENGGRNGGNGANGASGGWTLVEILSLAFGAGAVLSITITIVIGHIYMTNQAQRMAKRLECAESLSAEYARARSSFASSNSASISAQE